MVISEKAHAECVRLLDLLTNKRVQESWSWVFMSPVTDIPGYHAIIKKPMDLGTVKKNLGSKPSRCRFKSHERFAKDVRLVFQNALLYNKDDEHVKGSVYDAAQHLLRVFDTAYSKSKETVFVDENEEDGAHEEMDTSGSAHASGSAAPASDAEPHQHHSHHSSSSSHRHSSSDHDGKHKKDKSSKKEKKAKKSKKKSKDKDRERSRDKKHSSSSSSSAPAPVSSASAPPPPTSTTSTHSTSAVAAPPPPPAPVSALVAPVASTSVVSSSASTTGGKMSEEVVSACLSVLMKLIKYKEGNFSPAAPFLQPVDLTHFPDYRIKVPHRMHLYGVQKKLRSGGYADIDAFAHDMRLIFSNCLIYNSDVILSKVMRSHAVTLMKLFETQLAKIGGTWPGIPERWKCHQLLHELLAHRTDGQETAQWFKYPFKTYFDSPDHVPYGYFKTIKHPMDLGTVSANLHLGTYKHVSEFLQDAKLVFDNCIRYWASDPNGQAYCESAKTLTNLIKTQATSLFGSSVMEKALSKEKSKSSSSSSSKERKSSSSSATASVSASTAATGDEDRSKKRSKHSSSFAEREVCFEIVKLLRQHKMKGYRGIEILTAGPFIHAVDVTKYPDYLQVISEPMDFAKIERKLKGDRYTDVNEFCADVHLIFTNCHKYNSDPVEGADIRAMASNLRDYFVELYNERFGTGQTKPSVKEVKVETSSSGTAATSSATATSSKSVAAPMPSPKKPKKSPAPSPTKSSSSAEPRTSSSASAPSRSPQISSRSSSVKVPEARLSSSSVAPPPPATSTAVDVKPPAPPLSERELEELRRLKKEKKEKKEKKKKDKKEKKEKKEKKKKKKDKEKEGGSADKVDTKPASSSSVSATVGASRAAPTSSTAVSKPAAPPTPARPTHVPSKITPSEAAASSSSRSKSKKSKKTDLNSWESSCERVLNRLQKIEQVTKLHFDKPLVEVFPQLASEYLRLIPEPMDLRTLRERLHAHGLSSATDFVRKGRLIFQNAIKFNCAEDLASAHVREMSAHLLWYFDSLCAEQKLADSPEDKTKRQEMRRERAELVDTVPMEVKAKECQKLLRVLNSQKYDKNCWPFRKPVKVLFPTISPDYFEFIKTPMDLATITEKVNAFEYRMHGEFIRDVRLTFENAISYNRADKDREGWSVYAAAVHMLSVVEELWCDVTLEVLEKVRRREIVRKERERLGEKRKGEKRPDAERKVALVSASRPSAVPEEKTHKIRLTSSQDTSSDTNLILKGSVTIPAGGSSSKDEESSTKLKLQLVSRNLDRMNKSERKAEEKRRKRIRREEEMARSEKRRRTAVAATDEALREAELRSRRRLQKLEIAEAVKLREERERKMKEANEEKALAAKRKFNASVWNGKLTPVVQTSQGFWSRKRTKLEIPLAFRTTIDSC
ncbi:hypothetical protein Poli38472_013561 [Pythium oligandrum]|uniref:Bromo domain-containing protein n=1 Tax=Pythium oligandrum TaxID=41045 RepID=A0A8K1CDP0_PYTOL|nr:hypothetical protein Poli38472_013561 [Pythium oligandrum]|eukprot:TMW61098.1 hypothetical protein Poli38472_013561 [Pythium oligandrum]